MPFLYKARIECSNVSTGLVLVLEVDNNVNLSVTFEIRTCNSHDEMATDLQRGLDLVCAAIHNPKCRGDWGIEGCPAAKDNFESWIFIDVANPSVLAKALPEVI